MGKLRLLLGGTLAVVGLVGTSMPAVAASVPAVTTGVVSTSSSELAASADVKQRLAKLQEAVEKSAGSDVFVVGSAVEDGPAPAARGIASTGIGGKLIACFGKYDYPHPSAGSEYTAINAHLSVWCESNDDPAGAKATHIMIGSRMTDEKRVGKTSPAQGAGRVVKIGGEISCLKEKRTYQPIGYIGVTFPPTYKQIVD